MVNPNTGRRIMVHFSQLSDEQTTLLQDVLSELLTVMAKVRQQQLQARALMVHRYRRPLSSNMIDNNGHKVARQLLSMVKQFSNGRSRTLWLGRH